MAQHRVTETTFGLGFQLGSTRTRVIKEHIREVAADGWDLVSVDHSAFEIPLTWRFFWRKSQTDGAPEGTEHSRP